VIIPNRIIIYISSIGPTISPSQPSPILLQAIARGFIVLFCIDIWNPSTIFHHPNLNSPYLLPQVPTHAHTVPILQSCLSLLISKSMFKGVSWCIPAVSILYFDPFNHFHYSPLPLPSHSSFFNSFQYFVISSTFTDVMFYDIVDALSFSFPFPPSLSSTEEELTSLSSDYIPANLIILKTFCYGKSQVTAVPSKRYTYSSAQ
jgi:hypothetical protein